MTVPSMPKITSPGSRPALAAGPSSSTAMTSAPCRVPRPTEVRQALGRVLRVHAQTSPPHAAVMQQPVLHLDRHVDGNGEG